MFEHHGGLGGFVWGFGGVSFWALKRKKKLLTRLQGVITPLLTPYENDGTIARDLWVSHAKWVLAQGAHYLSPFGTTGEASSMSVAERLEAVDWLIDAGVPASRLMPGTGMTSLAETLMLSRHAVKHGCAAIMVLPSYFFAKASQDGHFRYFRELIEGIDDDNLKVCLYNIPQNSGVAISPALAARLNREFSDSIVAYKDSSGDWQNTLAVIKAAPALSVFPGSESLLTTGIGAGVAGCISATMNINAGAIRRVFDDKVAGNNCAQNDADIKTFRDVVQNADLISAMKATLAIRRNDDRWLNTRAPLLNADKLAGTAVLKKLGKLAGHI